MAAAITGTPRHFHTKFKFLIEIDKLGSVAFQNCSELKVDVAKIEYYEGGVISPFKEPGRLTFSDITLERACTYDADLYAWLQLTADASKNTGLRSPNFKRNGQVVQLDRNNGRLRTWSLWGLWPMSFTAGAWDNTSDEMTMEQIVLAVDYFKQDRNVQFDDQVVETAVNKSLGLDNG